MKNDYIFFKKEILTLDMSIKTYLKFTLQITFLPITFKKFQKLPQLQLWQAPDSVSNIFFQVVTNVPLL